MLNNHLSENYYIWRERNVQSAIKAVTGRPILDRRVREGFLKKRLKNECELKTRGLEAYTVRIQICVLSFLGGKNKGNDGGAVFA